MDGMKVTSILNEHLISFHDWPYFDGKKFRSECVTSLESLHGQILKQRVFARAIISAVIKLSVSLWALYPVYTLVRTIEMNPAMNI